MNWNRFTLLILIGFLLPSLSGAEGINYCKYLLVKNFTSDPYGLAAELRSQAATRGFLVITSSSQSMPAEEILRSCEMGGSWSATGLRGNMSLQVRNATGSIVAETSATIATRVNVSRTVQMIVSKVYSQLNYTGFDEAGFQRDLLQRFPSRPTFKISEEAIKKSEPTNPIEGIWTDDKNQYRLGIVPVAPTSGSDYVAVVLQSHAPLWQVGEIKAEIRKTAAPNIFTCTYYMANKKSVGTTLIMENDAMMHGSSPIDYGATAPFNLILIRVWPTTSERPATTNTQQTPTRIVATGTGFPLTHSGLIATNWHVVENAKNITVSFPNWSGSVGADLVVKDKINDLAILRVSDLPKFQNGCGNFPFQLISSGVVTLGEHVSTIGYPLSSILGSNPKFAEGVISSKSGMQDDPRWLQISAQVQPGSSGSPLFDSNGNIVGIVVAKLDDAKAFQSANTIPQNVNFAVKSDYLLSLLSMLPGDAPATRTIGFSPESASQCVAIIQAW